jgi:hypothetical protein
VRGPETGVLVFLLADVRVHAQCGVFEIEHSCFVLFILEVNNSNKVIRTARGAISGNDSMMYTA